MTPAESIIGKFDGITKTAKSLGIPVSTVQGWKERGVIPQRRWGDLIKAAHSAGVSISPDDFLLKDGAHV